MTRTRTAALATVVGVAALVSFAGPASAHVGVSAQDATQGGYAVVTFRVPNEEADASTTTLQVQLPTDTPLAYAATRPLPGWTATETKTKLATPVKTDDGELTEAVTQITWTATSAAAIKPGEFQQFDVQLGPLPDKDSITFPAIQTYSNGDVVRWVERQAPGSTEEPDKPAPVLALAAAGSGTDHHGAATGAASGDASVSASPVASEEHSDSSSNTGPIVISIVALVLAVGALGLSVVNRARRSS